MGERLRKSLVLIGVFMIIWLLSPAQLQQPILRERFHNASTRLPNATLSQSVITEIIEVNILVE